MKKNYRNDFELLKKGEWVYLNNAAQTLVPHTVIDSMNDYYTQNGANIHRGVDTLGYEATMMYENARQRVADLLGAKEKDEIVFTKSTTSSLNLVANSYGERIKAGDEIVLSQAEHHANFVPWQQLALRKNAKLVFAKLKTDGSVDIDDFKQILSPKTKIVAVAQMTNVLGAINDIETIAKLAHEVGAVIVVDGAQGITHIPTNVNKWDIDFYALGAHKMLGPTGIGALYGKKNLLKTMPPVESGGDMVDIVEMESTTFLEPPQRFEAGTPMIAEAIGWARAIDYFLDIGYAQINDKIKKLRKIAVKRMKTEISDIVIYNENNIDAPMITFNIQGIHSHDTASVLDKHKICVRAGHHCAQPMHKWLKISSSVRVSFMFYNNEADVDRLIEALKSAKEFIDVLF